MIEKTPTQSRLTRFALSAAVVATTAFALGTIVGCEDDAELDIDTRLGMTPVAFQDGATAQRDGEALMIRKTFPETVRLGSPIRYMIDIENISGGDLNGVVLREKMPEGMEFVGSSPRGEMNDSGEVVFRLGSMAGDATKQIQIEATPQSSGALELCTTYDFERGLCGVLNVVDPDLTLLKAGPDVAGICEPAVYTYTIKNEGDTEATDVVIYDELPEGLMVQGGNRKISEEIGTLAPGESREMQITVMAERPTTFASYAYAESNFDEVRSKSIETEFLAPELQVEIKPSKPFAYVGKDARFEVTIRNVGETAAMATAVGLSTGETGQLAAVYGSENGGAQLAAGVEGEQSEAFRFGSLQAGQSRTFFVDVDAETAGDLELEAAAIAACPNNKEMVLAEASSAASIDVRTIAALQLEVIDSIDPVKVGEETVYLVRLINEGSGDDGDINISAELPRGATFVSAEGSSKITADGGRLSFATVSDLPAGEKVEWYITAKVENNGGTGQFKVKANSRNLENELNEDEPTTLY